jgi:NAD(P)-dependent dehydrogenase (short-subunit alcohol dehydrogenase family)
MTDTKIALVTGGSRGLGRNMVLSLARRGVNGIFTYHRREDEAQEVVREVEKGGAKAVALRLDTADIAGFPAFVGALRGALASLGDDKFDFLVNNAGTGLHKGFAETSEAEFDVLCNIHLKGVFFLTQALLPLIRDGGRIVNLSSGLTRIIIPNMGAYAAMKGAIEVLTKYLAKELGPRGIAVNVVAPGAIETDFGDGVVRDNAEMNKYIASNTALGRAGIPDDIGPMVASLLSEENRWINAQRIEVSGGQSI